MSEDNKWTLGLVGDKPTTGALRFDTGKAELHHIHPAAWKAFLKANAEKLNATIIRLSGYFDEYFYFDNDGLEGGWAGVDTSDVLQMTKVLEFGAKKYASLNYAKGMKYSRVINSFRRHILQLISGETNDAESGITHLGHIMCNYMFMLTYSVEKPEGCDDRVILVKGEK